MFIFVHFPDKKSLKNVVANSFPCNTNAHYYFMFHFLRFSEKNQSVPNFREFYRWRARAIPHSPKLLKYFPSVGHPLSIHLLIKNLYLPHFF